MLPSGGGGGLPAESRQARRFDEQRDRQGEGGGRRGAAPEVAPERRFSPAVALSPPPKWLLGDGENSKARVAELEEEVQTLKKVNKDLYDFSSQLLTKAT